MTAQSSASREIASIWRDSVLAVAVWTLSCLAFGWLLLGGRPYLIRDLSFLADPESLALIAAILLPAGALLGAGARAVRTVREAAQGAGRTGR